MRELKKLQMPREDSAEKNLNSMRTDHLDDGDLLKMRKVPISCSSPDINERDSNQNDIEFWEEEEPQTAARIFGKKLGSDDDDLSEDEVPPLRRPSFKSKSTVVVGSSA